MANRVQKTKKCTACGQEKKINASNFRRSKGPDGVNYYTNECVLCLVKRDEAVAKHVREERRTQKETRAVMKADTKRKARSKAKDAKRYRKMKKEKTAQQQELARRVLARRKLIHYIKRFDVKYKAGWVHYDICRRLEKFLKAVENGESPRLMLFVPPRHGKSLIASDYFPSFALGHNPDFEIIAASYAVSLPLVFSRKVRDRLTDPAYTSLFPQTKLNSKSKSAEAWLTTAGGGYVAAGVGGGITGKGAHILVIDDPVKDAEEADSENARDGVWNWYGSTAYTRLAPGGGVLVIQTRWHDDDLSGRLIQQMVDLRKEGRPEEEIDNWEIISYPAVATQDEYLNRSGDISEVPLAPKSVFLRKRGEALHSERFPIGSLRKIKNTLQPRHWSALYQQNPVPDEGIFFTKGMFRFMNTMPPLSSLRMFAAFDLAIGENSTNDYTVGAVGGIDYNDQMYVVDIIRFRGDTYRIVESILNVYKKYNPDIIGIEKGQLELAVKPQLKKRMRERRLFPTLAEGKKALQPISDKTTRARPLQGRMQQGMVYFPQNAPWFEETQHELLRFPGGVHDDIVDALAWLMRTAMRENPPPKPKHKKMASWKDKLGKHMSGGGAVDHMSA